MNIEVTTDFQTAPIYDPELHPPGRVPVFSNQGAVDVFIDDNPNMLNLTPVGIAPIAGIRLPAGTGLSQTFAPIKLYARAASRTTIVMF